MAVKLCRNQGMSLAEVLIAALLISIVFAAASTVYVSALRFLRAAEANRGALDVYIATEHIAKKARLAGLAAVDQVDQQVKIRWDYQLNTFALNPGTGNTPGTPSNYTDDTWVKYRIIGNRLRWRNDASQAVDVAEADAEVVPGLVLESGSSFTLVNPSAQGAGVVLEIALVAQTGSPVRAVKALTQVRIGAASKS